MIRFHSSSWLSKTYYLLWFFSTKLGSKRVEQVLPEGRGGWKGKVAQIMYPHISTCKNDKIKFKKITETNKVFSKLKKIF
jgi:hypothetical protein